MFKVKHRLVQIREFRYGRNKKAMRVYNLILNKEISPMKNLSWSLMFFLKIGKLTMNCE